MSGERAVRVDILERLADLIRPAVAYRPGVTPGDAPPGAADGNGFVVTVGMTSLAGCSGEAFASILKSLGFHMETRPGPAITVPLVPKAPMAPAQAVIADETEPGPPASGQQEDAVEDEAGQRPAVPDEADDTGLLLEAEGQSSEEAVLTAEQAGEDAPAEPEAVEIEAAAAETQPEPVEEEPVEAAAPVEPPSDEAILAESALQSAVEEAVETVIAEAPAGVEAEASAEAQPEPAESVETLSRDALHFPVMPDRAAQRRDGLQFREVGTTGDRTTVVLEKPGTDAQLRYVFRREAACWTLVKIVDPAFGKASPGEAPAAPAIDTLAVVGDVMRSRYGDRYDAVRDCWPTTLDQNGETTGYCLRPTRPTVVETSAGRQLLFLAAGVQDFDQSPRKYAYASTDPGMVGLFVVAAIAAESRNASPSEA